jgi:hypothetical protein
MPYSWRPEGQSLPQLDDASAELRELIGEHNALDVELYRFVRGQV